MIEYHFILLTHYPLLLVFIGALLGAETVVLFATIICHSNDISPNLIIIIAICGAILGNQIWFYIGKIYGERLLKKHNHLKNEVFKFKKWINNKSALMAISARFVYGAGSITPLLLGINHYPQLHYSLFNTIGSIVWGIIVVKLGSIFSNQSYRYFENPKHLEYFIVVIILLILTHWWYKHKSIAQKLKKSS